MINKFNLISDFKTTISFYRKNHFYHITLIKKLNNSVKVNIKLNYILHLFSIDCCYNLLCKLTFMSEFQRII